MHFKGYLCYYFSSNKVKQVKIFRANWLLYLFTPMQLFWKDKF